MNDMTTRIRTLMEEQRITQKRLATMLQVSTSALCNYLQGNRWISIPMLRKLCLALDVSADYILGLSNEKKPNEFTPDEKQLLSMYRALPARGKSLAVNQLRDICIYCQVQK